MPLPPYSAPALPVQTNRTINELTLLTVTNTATDTDLPANTLSYLLIGPSGATIDANGVITWTPAEDQGPGSDVEFTTIVTDAAPHHLIADGDVITHRRTRAGDRPRPHPQPRP